MAEEQNSTFESKITSIDNTSQQEIPEIKLLDFGCIPVDSVAEKYIYIPNRSNDLLSYRVTMMYILNTIDRVFSLKAPSSFFKPGESCGVRVTFRPNVVGQSFTDYYIIDDSAGNVYRLTITGKCYGPEVYLDRKKIHFTICKNVSENRVEKVKIMNVSSVDATYQWVITSSGQGYFQISRGNCGVVTAMETFNTSIYFSGTGLGIYTAELVCLVLHQEPLYLNVFATVTRMSGPDPKIDKHIFQNHFMKKTRTAHLMENSLRRMPYDYIPPASILERYLDFGSGSSLDIFKNITQTISVTNHGRTEGSMFWVPDFDNVFLIDPIDAIIPPQESRLFAVRFRPVSENYIYSFLLCGDFHSKVQFDDDVVKTKHTWYRIPCIGNTWESCYVCTTDYHCPTEVVMPPTSPKKTTFSNFMISNKSDQPMDFKFEAPATTNYIIMPMCGIVQGRGWQIITVALEPMSEGEFIEAWDLVINKVHRARVCLTGNAELSQVEVMSHGNNSSRAALFEFPPTITGCTNYSTAYLHNLTRMEIHLRVVSSVNWLGSDQCGSIVIPPREIVCHRWWFFPKQTDVLYETIITCTCCCLINGRPVGEPSDLMVQFNGYSELPNLQITPKETNIYEVPVTRGSSAIVTLNNCGCCFFTSKLYYEIDGMGDDWSNDKFKIIHPVNSLKPLNNCYICLTATPYSVGMRQINIKYTVLFRDDSGEIKEIQPDTSTIGIFWYEGIYPTPLVKRTICVESPIILSNHCVWNNSNVDALNKALDACRPNIPLDVNLYAPDLCASQGVVELLFVVGTDLSVRVPWSLTRKKICACEMIEVQIGFNLFEMKHNCIHRELFEMSPVSGLVMHTKPNLIKLRFKYLIEGDHKMCYILSLPNDRSICIYMNMIASAPNRGLLAALRRPIADPNYLTILDCGRVRINNLDPVVRVAWLYNPTDVYVTWRLIRGVSTNRNYVIRCLLYFAEVPPLGKLAIPFAFLPIEMIDYQVVFQCSFGYHTIKILVTGQGGLPHCFDARMDLPPYIERTYRNMYRDGVYLSCENLVLPIMPTHSVWREILSINNSTDHIMRFIWLPERLSNIMNIVMTPCWGILQPHSAEWITMTIYTLQEPATLTTTLSCEILDMTMRRNYQRNELLRKMKKERCDQEFIIIEEGTFHKDINDSPPYVLDIEKPQSSYLCMSIAMSTKGQRDGYPILLLRKMLEHTPAFDLLMSDVCNAGGDAKKTGNSMPISDIIRIIDCILWDALHSKMFRNQIQYYSKEEFPTYSQVLNVLANDETPKLSRRVTAGICDAIVNKAVFNANNLGTKQHDIELSILEID